MDGSIQLTAKERKVLLKSYRSGDDVRVARRVQVVLLHSDGWTYRRIREVTFASNDFISNSLRQFRASGPFAK